MAEPNKTKTSLPKIGLIRFFAPKENKDMAMLITSVEKDILNNLFFNSRENYRLVRKWFEMSEKGTRRMSYRYFMKFFGFRDETWIRRLFDIINSSLTGMVTLAEFLQFCLRYLIIDRHGTEELSFRLLSRRGTNFVAKWSVLDLEDIANFISFRYSEIKKLSSKRKKAFDVLIAMDLNEDGGVDIIEFQTFCAKNPTFPRLFHALQNYMRRRIFGLDFWVSKSRKVKYSKTSGLDALTILSRVNLASENYAAKYLGDPVVVSSPIMKRRDYLDESSFAAADAAEMNIPTLREDSPKKKHESTHECFSFSDPALQRPYVLDFSDVARAAAERRIIRNNLRAERKLQIRSVSGQMYQQMLFIFEDFAHNRRNLRLGFNRWLEVLGKTPKRSPLAKGDDLGEIAVPRQHSPQIQTSSTVEGQGQRQGQERGDGKSNKQQEIDEDDEQQLIQKGERSDNSIYSRIVNSTNNMKVIAGESCVDNYITEYTAASMNNSGSNRMDAMLQMRRELQCARLVAEGRADDLRLRMDTLRSHMTSLRNEIDPPAPEETAASRKSSLPRLRQNPGNKKTASPSSPSKLGT